MHKVVKQLMGKVIVSCEAYEDTPLYGPQYMEAMAKSVCLGGAAGIRACWPQDIKAIKAVCDVPIIGIYKEFTQGDPLDQVFITPNFERAKEVIEAGADILGIDATLRPTRGKAELKALLKEIKTAYPNIVIMADLATIEEGVFAQECGYVDIISTTLSGYTRNSVKDTDGPDFALIKALKQAVHLPINGEGRIWEVQDMEDMFEAGADMVTLSLIHI